MKFSKKPISLLLAVFMLATAAPTVFATDEECKHERLYMIDVYPDGCADKYFMTAPFHIYNEDYSIAYDQDFYYCPDCRKMRWGDEANLRMWLDEEDIPYTYGYGVHAPNSCIHKNQTLLPVKPTCKSAYFDLGKFERLGIFGEVTEEQIQIDIENQGIIEPDGIYPIINTIRYCNDCNELLYRMTAYTNTYEELEYVDQTIKSIIDYNYKEDAAELFSEVSSCLKPAEPHKYENGKCIYCSQTEPTAPTETENKSFIDYLVDFFRNIGDLLKNLFSFGFIKDLFNK